MSAEEYLDYVDWKELASLTLAAEARPRRVRQYHHKRFPDEPECPLGKWRTRDRNMVVDIRQMDDSYLDNCLRFTVGKRQHADKRIELLNERARRDTMKKIDTRGMS